MAEFLKALIIMSLGGSIMGSMLIIMRRVIGKRLPSAFYYYAWLPVLIRLLLPLPGAVSAIPASGDAALSAAEDAVMSGYSAGDSYAADAFFAGTDAADETFGSAPYEPDD